MILSFMSTLAQEESHTKSEIMNSSIEMRFRRGIFLTPPLLGYDRDENGDLVINPHEAKIVQLIFYMYLNGSSTQQIADSLTELGCKTKKNNDVWSSSTILQILQNERHCGDVLARKHGLLIILTINQGKTIKTVINTEKSDITKLLSPEMIS